MALTVKSNLVIEDIVDEKGEKIGQIKFNPNDSRIMKNLSSIVNDFSNAIKDFNQLGEVEKIDVSQLKTAEDFEKASAMFEKVDKGFDIEVKAIDEFIDKLSEIFGKETIELFTNGTKDAECLFPIIDFIKPYVEKARTNKVNKYIDKDNQDVME